MGKSLNTGKKSDYDQRYRHKLNMLEPGCRMLKIAGALGLAGLILHWAGQIVLSRAALVIAALIVLVLLLLVRVELHQDRVLNDIALREMQEKEKQ